MSNHWKVDCANIMSNLKKSIQNNYPDMEPTTNTHSFTSSKEDFLLLNLDCEKELQDTKRNFIETGILLKYDMLYNTKYPYKITYTPEIKRVSIWQDQGEIFMDTVRNNGVLDNYTTLENKNTSL